MEVSPGSTDAARGVEDAPDHSDPRWFEVWTTHEGDYVLVLKALRDGRFVIYDPQSQKVDSVLSSYEEAELNLSEDEFVLIAGREQRDDDEADDVAH
ncbi:MAG TPA: hypothetical protein VM580_30010 [Labilithrix sp.]|jgi:hypothetical protein|nr:hypothetical protein [Labilithrix sp.]